MLPDLATGLLVIVTVPPLLIWFLPSWIHELGHYASARIVGAQFEYVPLGPLVLQRHLERPRLRLALRRSPCAAVLPTPGRRARSQLLISTLCGPLLCVVLGAVALFFVAGAIGLPNPYLPLYLFGFGAFALVSGIRDLMPWRPVGVPSDGARAISLIRGRSTARRYTAWRSIIRQAEHGVRPREWDVRDIASLDAARDGSLDDIAAAMCLYWYRVDSGELETARDLLATAHVTAGRGAAIEMARTLLLVELGYVEARLGHDPNLAKETLSRSSYVSEATLCRATAAVLLTFGHWATAEKVADAGLASLSPLRRGFVPYERDLLLALRAEARDRQSGGSDTDIAPKPVLDIVFPPTFSGHDHQALASVLRAATPDALRDPVARPARAGAALVAGGLLGTGTYLVLNVLRPEVGGALGIFVAALAVVVAIRLPGRMSDRKRATVRSLFAAIGAIAFIASVLAGSFIRLSQDRYIWFVAQSRPCVSLGPGSTVSAVWIGLLLFGIGSVGILLGTRRPGDALVPLKGLIVGIAIVFVTLIIVPDAGTLSRIVGCTR